MITTADGRTGGPGEADNSHPTSPRAQRAKRYRVHLEIRYQVDGEYVSGFAENVSRGGLFIVDAQDLARGTLTTVQIALPGGPEYTVSAEVRHILPQKTAKSLNRKAGAGVMFQEKPTGFDASVSNYLFRLARREEVAVMVTDASSELLIRSAGYVTQRAPKADDIGEALRASMQPVIGVVVRSAEAEPYCTALEKQDAQDLVIELEDVAEFDKTLSLLDKRLSEEAPITLNDGDVVDEMEDLPGPPEPSSSASSSSPPPPAAPTARGGAAVSRRRPTSTPSPSPRGPSYSFAVICILLAGAIGFAAAFLMYFDRAPTQYARRASRSTCTKCQPCPSRAPRRTPPPRPAP